MISLSHLTLALTPTLTRGHRDLAEPLDHPAADVAGDNETERVAVVGVELLAWLGVRVEG